MKKSVSALLPTIILLSCAAGVQYYKFAEPTSNDTMLVVGRVLMEDNEYSGRHDVVTSGIEVAILGLPDSSSDVTGLWAMTDRNGYFALANVPQGIYALKGIRVTLSDGQRIILSNPLIKERSFFRFNPPNTETILIEGDNFILQPVGRVISLQHNIFRLNPKATMFSLESDTKQILKNIKLVNGKVANDPTVEEYFLEHYADTQWGKDLEASSKVPQRYQ